MDMLHGQLGATRQVVKSRLCPTPSCEVHHAVIGGLPSGSRPSTATRSPPASPSSPQSSPVTPVSRKRARSAMEGSESQSDSSWAEGSPLRLGPKCAVPPRKRHGENPQSWWIRIMRANRAQFPAGEWPQTWLEALETTTEAINADPACLLKDLRLPYFPS